MKLSVIIPCYNEAQDISQNVELVKQYLIKSGIDYELIVVDDGSDDNTKEVIWVRPDGLFCVMGLFHSPFFCPAPFFPLISKAQGGRMSPVQK